MTSYGEGLLWKKSQNKEVSLCSSYRESLRGWGVCLARWCCEVKVGTDSAINRERSRTMSRTRWLKGGSQTGN